MFLPPNRVNWEPKELVFASHRILRFLILLLGNIIYKSLFLRYDRGKTPPPTGEMLLWARRQEAIWKRSPTN